MPSYNQVILIGNLTRDPELRVLPKGTSICQFGICVNREFKDESGQKREEATFVDCEAWAKTAETIAKYCTKGKLLLVCGRLKLDTWEDKQSGQKRSKLKVVLESFQFLGGKNEALNDGNSSPHSAPTPTSAPASTPVDDQDVPF